MLYSARGETAKEGGPVWRERWRQLKPAVRAAYLAAAVGAVAVLVGAVIEATLPLMLEDEPQEQRDAPGTITLATPSLTPRTTAIPPTTISRPATPSRTPPDAAVYLADEENGALSGDWANGSWHIGGENYIRSVRTYCGKEPARQAQVWSTAGFRRLTGVVGFADDEGDVVGVTARISIVDQDGRQLKEPFDIALGRSMPIDVELDGAVQTQIICTGRGTGSGEFRWDFHVILGDAALRQ